MKKLILLLFIAITIISCVPSNNVITEQQFINDLNSFDSTATYSSMICNTCDISFVISSNDSLFVYNVEKTSIIGAIYVSKKVGDKVK